MLGNLVKICLFGNNIDKATEIILKLNQNQNEIVGVPDSETIGLFFNYCIENNNFNELLVSITIFFCL